MKKKIRKNYSKPEKKVSKHNKKITHEQKVSRFYTCGSAVRSCEAGGFLSFGYWDEGICDYYTAAKRLLDYVLDNSGIEKAKNILNVACGYGTETITIYERFKPQKIYAIDITGSHIEFAKKRAEETGYNIKFQVKNACRTGFPDSYFSHVIGIEGPAHFNTRKDFMREAFRVLKPGGHIILTDIIAQDYKFRSNPVKVKIAQLCSTRWHMPAENWADPGDYRRLVEETGFTVEKFEVIGDKVYPGFSASNLRFASIINAVKTRGFFAGCGLTIISWLLGFVYRRKMIDYVFLKAKK